MRYLAISRVHIVTRRCVSECIQRDVQVYARKTVIHWPRLLGWGLPFILEWSELYELWPELYEPLIGAGWQQETSGRSVKLRVVQLANLRLTTATALHYLLFLYHFCDVRISDV